MVNFKNPQESHEHSLKTLNAFYEYDDFMDESEEILNDQGRCMPYSFGLHILGCVVGALFEDLDQRGLLSETLVVALGEFGRSPEKGVSTSGNGNSADGRDHWPYCYTSIVAGAGIKRGYVHGE